MKKLLLLSIVLFIGCTVFAQKANVKAPYDMRKALTKTSKVDVDPTLYTPSALPASTYRKGVTDITKVPVTSSFNVYGGLYAEQTCLTYNKDLNLIMHTSRANPPVIGAISGDIVTTISEDNGASFTKIVALADGLLHRYPGGVISNPVAGNTTVNNAYSVLAGPRTDGSSWVYEFYSSQRFDGTNQNILYRPNTAGDEFVVTDGLTATDDGNAHVSALAYVVGGTGYRGDVSKGVFNSGTNAFDWTYQDIIPDIHLASDNTYDFTTRSNMAWSQDGMVGYYFITAVDNRPSELGSYAPIIYKTVNAGETWTEMDYVNYTNNPVISPYILSTTDPSITKPFFVETDGIVDMNNDLHIFARCIGAYSNDPDSLGYTWTVGGNAERGAIFECFTQGNQWMVQYVDTLISSAPSATQTGYGVGTLAEPFDMRLQAARTTDGSKVFCTWTDTDTVFATPLNLNPDLFVWGHDIATNKYTTPKNVTFMSDVWGECFYSYTSPTVMDNDPGVYELPITITDIKTTNDPGKPVYHYYVKGVQLDDAEFIWQGINKPSENLNVAVSQNVPNPFSGTTKIQVNLAKTSDLSIAVYNLTGQKVYEQNFGSTPAGMHNISINGSNLKAGVYCYTVKAGENKVTKKMIVK
jgi:hypothetical protein